MDRSFKLPLAVLLACTAAPVVAAEAADANDAADSAAFVAAEPAAQTEIVVTGERAEYGVRATTTATRTKTDIRNIPQALTVISESQIEDQAMRSIAELLTFVPGATPGTGESNRDQITLRGNNTTADFFIDGLRDDVQYFRDFYNVERVEVLRGPNAMIFGRGGGGGVVNRVTKRSSLGAHREGLLSGDSFGGFRLAGDVDQPLASGVGLRINGLYEDGDSFRRHVGLKRYGINPTAAILIGANTRVDLAYEFFRDRRTADRGVPSRNGEPLRDFDRTFFGDPDKSFSRADVQLATFGIEHQFGDGLSLRHRTLYGDYDKFYQNIYPNGPAADPDGAGPRPVSVRLAAYNDSTERRNLLSQTDLIWENRLAGLDQTLLLGFEVGRQKGNNQRRNGVFGADPLQPLDAITADIPVNFTGGGANNDMKTNVAAAYIQDQIRPNDWIEIVAGLRFDRLSMNIDNLNNGLSFGRTDQLWSPRIGVILKPLRNVSLYTSYGRSYLPQAGDQFNSLAANTETLKPERFDNLEAGLKWEPVQGLLATAAIYQLDRTNTRLVDPANPAQFVLSGKQRSRGLELGLERSISDRWQISAGYSWQKAQVTQPTTACVAGDCQVPLVPRHSFSLWNRYDFTNRIGAGFGVIARSKSFASISNHVRLPAYARIDGAVFYRLPNGFEAQVNVENILGADYYPTAHNDNNIAPGTPRTLKATVGYRF